MQRIKEILVLLLLLLLVVPAETFAQSAGGQISRKPKTAVKKETPAKKKTPSKSTAKKPAAKKAVRSSKPIPNGAVDLGLPSGTLWADRNIGADSPEGYGDYFAWGETRPKSVYNWSTYKYCKGSYDTLTKYNNKSSYGTIDNKTILEASDDAATVNWGNSWRMPTHAEQVELNQKCTWTWTTRNGVNGYKVVGPNGNSIFLPSAGCRDESSVHDDGSLGYYWSASLYESYPYNAWNVHFYTGPHGSYNYYGKDRYCGYCVRAVVSMRSATPSSKPKTECTSPSTKQKPSTTSATQSTAKREPCSPTPTTVDLGLRSGTLWADRNIGASSPEGYGDYFAWGEIRSKPFYDWTSYKYCKIPSGTLTKYNNNNSRGTVDNKTALESADDAAIANWGNSWRIPTLKEWDELNYKCTWVWTTRNGVNGYKVTGPNGNSIFLPAAGCRDESSVYDAGFFGFYLSASLDESDPYDLWGMLFGSDKHNCSNDNFRYIGLSVRAVVNVCSATLSTATVIQSGAKRETSSPTSTAVDLGLPSGTLWADCNIGASIPEDYGDYFAWGETRPKAVYDWSTYKYSKGTKKTMTKYCTDSSYGTVDNKTVLEAVDDTAIDNWGNSWRMPTHKEMIELNEECTWAWTTLNGVNGYEVIGPNGNSIFLPAAGCCTGMSVNGVGTFGAYWPASLNENDPFGAWRMFFNSGNHNSNNYNYRYEGFSVRAVAR